MTNPGRREEDTDAEVRVGWRMSGLGMEVAAQVAAGALLGWLFDRWRGTDPTGLMVGGIAGIAVGLFSLVRGSLKLNRDLDRRHPTGGRGRALTDEDYKDKDKDEHAERE
jgi:F0F1-type ATP synthase assembly protein I